MTHVAELGQLDVNTLITLMQGAKTIVQSGVDVTKEPLKATIKSVSFASNYTPPRTYSGVQLEEMYRDTTPNPYLKVLQPTITLDTVFGKRTIAPYGPANPTVWEKNLKEVAILVASGTVIIGTSIFILGLLAGRR